MRGTIDDLWEATVALDPVWEPREELALVWQRIVAGDRIRIWCDYFGGHWIELTPRWQIWRRRRVRLSATEMFQVKSALSQRRRSAIVRTDAVI